MPRIITVGTDAVQLLAANPARVAWTVIMPATTIEAGNTGRVNIGLGFQPTTVVGAPDQGFILTASDQLRDAKVYEKDPSVWRGDVWARASAAGQRVWADEAVTSQLPITEPTPPEAAVIPKG